MKVLNYYDILEEVQEILKDEFPKRVVKSVVSNIFFNMYKAISKPWFYFTKGVIIGNLQFSVCYFTLKKLLKTNYFNRYELSRPYLELFKHKLYNEYPQRKEKDAGVYERYYSRKS